MYKIVEKNIGRAGNKYKMEEQKKEWDKKYGSGNWKTGYEFNRNFITREEAIEQIYDLAYFHYLNNHPEIVEQLKKAKDVFNPHAIFSKSTDIQAETVKRYMNSKRLKFVGNNYIPIGTYQPKNITPYHEKMIKQYGLIVYNGKIQYSQISYDLSPYNIKCLHDPNLSVEDFWQSSAKCLGILIK